ncbi:hypothetical protein ACVMIH_002245 [Bradyrhizobium sp. USDA 4503]
MAILVLAVMATDSVSDTDARIHQLAKARAKPRCKLTGSAFLVDALTAVFASYELAFQVLYVRVHRSTMACEIVYEKIAEPLAGPHPYLRPSTLFGRHPQPGRMDVEATLWGNLIRQIAELLKQQHRSDVNG